jgi:hypothetical protein
MKRIIYIFIMVMLVSCNPSPASIQTAIAKTQAAQPINNREAIQTPTLIETSTVIPINTPIPTKTQPEINPPIPSKKSLTINTLLPTFSATSSIGSRSNPVPLGKTMSMITDDKSFELSIVEIYRGKDAWDRIVSAHSFNQHAPEGLEYVLVKLVVNYTSGPEDSTLEAWEIPLYTVSDNNVLDSPMIYPPSPALRIELFPGGKTEGYTGFLVFIDDPNPLLLRGEPGRDAVYFSLTQ